MSSPDDFYLLTPLNPEAGPSAGGLSDYTCFEKRIHFYFCPNCGVRCFAFFGQSEVREEEVDGEKRRVWAPKKEGWIEGTNANGYLTVNAATLEPGQEGLSLKEWHEKGWIQYLDCKNEAEEDRLRDPHEGGMY